jgi:hypothetical protein
MSENFYGSRALRRPASGTGCHRQGARSEAHCSINLWWARQDSNLQPDRYERPALTIELQAPPGHGGDGADTPYSAARRPAIASFPGAELDPTEGGFLVRVARACPRHPRLCLRRLYLERRRCRNKSAMAPCVFQVHRGYPDLLRPSINPRRLRRIPPPCATFRSRRRSVCRTRGASSASAGRRVRQAWPPVWDPAAPLPPPC